MFPIVLALLAVVTLLVPSAAELEAPPEPVVDRTVWSSDGTAWRVETTEQAPALVEPGRGELPADQSVEDPVAANPDDQPPASEEQAPAGAPPVYFMPVDGVKVADVPPTFGDPRGSDRMHQGIDIVAPRGTPVRSAAGGVVWRTSDSIRGGISVTVIGDDGVRYFYTHLDSIADGIERDVRVGTDTVLGYVGNTGNAVATAPHLHFEVGLPIEGERYRWRPIDPLLYLLDR